MHPPRVPAYTSQSYLACALILNVMEHTFSALLHEALYISRVAKPAKPICYEVFDAAAWTLHDDDAIVVRTPAEAPHSPCL